MRKLKDIHAEQDASDAFFNDERVVAAYSDSNDKDQFIGKIVVNLGTTKEDATTIAEDYIKRL